jgi:hypothetical protein
MNVLHLPSEIEKSHADQQGEEGEIGEKRGGIDVASNRAKVISKKKENAKKEQDSRQKIKEKKPR